MSKTSPLRGAVGRLLPSSGRLLLNQFNNGGFVMLQEGGDGGCGGREWYCRLECCWDDGDEWKADDWRGEVMAHAGGR